MEEAGWEAGREAAGAFTPSSPEQARPNQKKKNKIREPSNCAHVHALGLSFLGREYFSGRRAKRSPFLPRLSPPLKPPPCLLQTSSPPPPHFFTPFHPSSARPRKFLLLGFFSSVFFFFHLRHLFVRLLCLPTHYSSVRRRPAPPSPNHHRRLLLQTSLTQTLSLFLISVF